MESVVTILTLLSAVVVSGSLARWTKLPLPLVQIGLGAMIALSVVPTVYLDPDVFFLLFLPPLLFLDGWRIPKSDLVRDGRIILELALGLVLFTVLGVGLLIHWLIPPMPLAVAFALAAIVSPTDPIAVSAIASRTRIPKRLMHILEGEALLNDASGLVCMRFAVAAVLTGAFSLQAALVTFAWLAIGGILIGVGLTWGVSAAKLWITRFVGEDTSSQILISLLIPFGAYLVAEHFHCSGILAVVAAGVTMSFIEGTGQALAVTRIRRAAVWDMIQFAANGVIFVLLGEQMPGIFSGAVEAVKTTGHREPWLLTYYVLAISLALCVLRFIWVWVSLRLTMFRATRKGAPVPQVGWRLITATSLAGVRGAITLAGVLTLPFALRDGSPFPARDLAIFLAAGVIVVSLVLASIALPPLLKDLKLPPEDFDQEEMDNARDKAARAAIQAIEQTQHQMAAGRADADLFAEASLRVMEAYRPRLEGRPQNVEGTFHGRRLEAIERKLRIAALRAERSEIFRLRRHRELNEEAAQRLIRDIDLLETRYTG
ncbi:Na+/H+ antiporter [Bosea sp. BIWAKO-01]|uniref:Na+/H+ antiporter n=1 Tax=Bosea sp. BIWAKO-01 TaxID=506668 RepID=UPI0008533465|nr:Na+/H+ antiporter [Bosea sp. BIWAKO-01]GAU85993.1 Na+/H+ antiporter [Bosea sp. BIWAKO-01]